MQHLAFLQAAHLWSLAPSACSRTSSDEHKLDLAPCLFGPSRLEFLRRPSPSHLASNPFLKQQSKLWLTRSRAQEQEGFGEVCQTCAATLTHGAWWEVIPDMAKSTIPVATLGSLPFQAGVENSKETCLLPVCLCQRECFIMKQLILHKTQGNMKCKDPKNPRLPVSQSSLSMGTMQNGDHLETGIPPFPFSLHTLRGVPHRLTKCP